MEAKERITQSLKDFGRLPTSRIRAICGFDFFKMERLLNELLSEKRIIKEKETNAIYWRLII